MKKILLVITGILICTSMIAQSAKEVSKLYKNKQYSKAIEKGIELLKEQPGNAALNSLLGRIYADDKQFEKAIPYLEIGTHKKNVSWVRGWSYAYLGKCFYATKQYEKSKNNYEACIKLKATKNSLNYAKRELQALQMDSFFDSWKIIETEHLRFHFQNINKIANRDWFIQSREKAYLEINKFCNAKPYKKIDFYVWEKPKQAIKKFGKPLGWASPDLCVINSKTNQTRGHEIAHILTHYGFLVKSRNPFINEGVAVYFDQSNHSKMSQAKQQLKGKKVDIINSWKNAKRSVDVNYTVAGAFIEYLHKNGTEAQLKELLKNQTVNAARKIYTNFNELVADFERILN